YYIYKSTQKKSIDQKLYLVYSQNSPRYIKLTKKKPKNNSHRQKHQTHYSLPIQRKQSQNNTYQRQHLKNKTLHSFYFHHHHQRINLKLRTLIHFVEQRNQLKTNHI